MYDSSLLNESAGESLVNNTSNKSVNTDWISNHENGDLCVPFIGVPS